MPLVGGTASAHPHVWASVRTEVMFQGDQITGLRHRWSFDEMYSTYALDGLDANGDGAYDASELAVLAKINVESLAEFDYFSFAKIEGEPASFTDPIDYSVERGADGILTLVFTLPLKAPVAPGSLTFSFSVYDPSFFIAFDFAEGTPVTLSAGAPAGCRAAVQAAAADSEANLLTQAFDSAGTVATGTAQEVIVRCRP